MSRQLRDELGDAPSASARLFGVPRLIVRLAARGDGPAALRRLTDDLTRDPGVRDEVCGSLRTWIDSVRADSAAAQEEGWWRAELGTDARAEIMVAAFIGAQTMTDQLGDDGLDGRVEALLELVRLAAGHGRQEGEPDAGRRDPGSQG